VVPIIIWHRGFVHRGRKCDGFGICWAQYPIDGFVGNCGIDDEMRLFYNDGRDLLVVRLSNTMNNQVALASDDDLFDSQDEASSCWHSYDGVLRVVFPKCWGKKVYLVLTNSAEREPEILHKVHMYVTFHT
jgi:hypothetical protein